VPIRVTCPHCLRECQIAEHHRGVPVQCAQCGKQFIIRAPAPAVPRLEIGAATSPGLVRKRNEDSFLVQHLVWSNLAERHELALLVVADGMGGYDGGDQASGMVIRTVGGALTPLLTGALNGQLRDDSAATLLEKIESALLEANAAILQRARNDSRCKGMGATAAVILIWDGHALIQHVGDCRVYHQQTGRLLQVTRDQTLVARMVEIGKLRPKEALSHPARNEVTQAVGKQPDLAPAPYLVRLAPGDWLLAACDGLHAHLEHLALQEEIAKAPPSAPALAQSLVDRVNERGGSDNCTILCVRCC
jgi:protein phosphatase